MSEITPHQRHVFALVAGAGFIQDHPHQRDAQAPSGNRQHQVVHITPPDFPGGAIQTQDPGRPDLHELDDGHSQRVPFQLHMLEKTLQTAIRLS